MKHRRQDAPSYSEAQATAWLAWLAQGMQQHGQTIFLIEQLQPSWLSTRQTALGLHLDVSPDLGRFHRADFRADWRADWCAE